MIRLIAPIAALLTGVALLLLGNGLLHTLLAVRGSDAGFADDALGLVMSCYFLGFLIGTFLAPGLIRRIGHIRAFAFLAAAVACSALLHGLWVSPWAWMLLRVGTGVALVGLYAVIESWLSAQTPREQRGRVFATYMVVNLGALAVAQQLLRIPAAEMPLTPFVLVALAVCAAVMPVTWTSLAQPPPQPETRLQLGILYRHAPTAAAGALLSGAAMGAFWGLGPVYAARLGFDHDQIATFMSAGVLGGAALQWPIGHFSDRHDRRAVLTAVCLAAAVVAVLGSSGLVRDAPWLYALMFVYGGLAFCVYPISIAHLTDHLEAHELVGGSSTALLLHGIGAALSPALAGALMAKFGATALFAYFAAMQGALALYVGRRYVLRGRPSEHPAHFMPMLRTTPAALELLPDADDRSEEQAVTPMQMGKPQ